MALRTIRVEGDPILRKECRPVKERNERTHILINDMFDTMYEADGVGLAGPQVGILKRLCVIDCGDDPLVLINPEIVSVEGEQIGQEGCLSVPGKYGIVKRPAKVTVRALNEDMEEYDKIMPEYGFAAHKGYGAQAHIEALKKYGPSPIHRKTFITHFCN